MKNNSEQETTISAAKIDANRRNAQKSTGPKDTTSTRFNAVKHGMLAEGVTELDNPETFPEFCAKIVAELKPVGEIETQLARRVALGMARLKRAAWLEAEFLTEKLNPVVTEGSLDIQDILGALKVLDPGLPARISADDMDDLNRFGRYETANENKVYRALQQLKQLQARRI